MSDVSAVDLGTRIRRWSEQMNPRLIVPCGVLGGLMLGVIARAWMRWISTDPEFSWGGTIGIVVGFVSFFTAHATVLFGKRKSWSRTWLTVSRVGAVIFSLPIFVAAGAIMFPTVLAGALSTGRTDWPHPIRGVIFVLGLIIPCFVVKDIGADFGWGITTAGRIILFVLIYSVVIAAARVTAAPLWRTRGVRNGGRK
ncbi:MAG: hypothetical protein ACYC06_02030 [Ilumatobacteraceae bacterium]